MRLYAITDRRLLPGTHDLGRLSAAEREGLLRLAGAWAAAGVEFIQLREKDLGTEDLAALTRAMVLAIRSANPEMNPVPRAKLLVNAGAAGAAEAARATGAAGIHLPGRWEAEQVGRARIAGIVSVGCHSAGEVAVARAAGADMALFSPVFPTESHPNARALGLEALSDACRTAGKVPVFALGGISRERAACCLEAGAAGVAGIRMFVTPSGEAAGLAPDPPGPAIWDHPARCP